MPVTLKEGTILDNMKVVAGVAEKLGGAENGFPTNVLEDLIRDKKRVDNLLVLSHQPTDPHEEGTSLASLLAKYRGEVNADLLFVSVDLSGNRSAISSDEKNPNDILIAGFSDQILRFIAERGDQNQVWFPLSTSSFALLTYSLVASIRGAHCRGQGHRQRPECA